MSFVHLHVHSQYSLLEASPRLNQLVDKAVRLEMPAVALTDNGNMFGAVEFYFACKAAGIKPIIGMGAYLAPKNRKLKGEEREQQNTPNRRLVLLAKDLVGYQNLCRLSTIGYQEGFYYKPRIDYEVLGQYRQGLIVLTGGWMGEVPWVYRNQGADAALEKIKLLKNLFPEDLYLELNQTGAAEWRDTNSFLQEVGESLEIPIVATNDVHYLEREDQLAQEVLVCIGSNRTLQDPSRFRLGSDQFYFKSAPQMRELFSDCAKACDQTLEIAASVKLELKYKDASGQQIYHLPTYPTDRGVKAEIERLSLEGLKERFEQAKSRGEEILDEHKQKYFSRLEYELRVIDQMGFSGYFLIVQDFIGWAKRMGIPVGPGRGSGAGSLVAYSLKITDLDPIRYNLVFERFLNPERISMPDFDVDFCQDRRGEVIEYVNNKYGRGSVSQIITFGKLQAKAAVRDVGRVLGMTFQEVDVIAKLIPEKLGITLKEAIESEARLREAMETDPKIATLLDLAQKIEGLVRHAGIHAAGVIICDGEIVAHAPLYRGVEGENVVQYDMKHSEKIGLIKFDFLGLKTLTLIHNALSLIEKNQKKKITTDDISLSDPGIYEIMCRGDTAGIFQFEGEGITDLIKKAKPNQFEDITAINALYRPGPMDMIPEYLGRKSGKIKVKYIFPELEDLLKETYGIVVYQEQVQLIAARIASYSLGEADVLRRAMGKKNPEEMAKQRERFLSGAKQNNFDLERAGELFDLMAEFAKYGFNKSHAAAYCVVAAQTAYLKNYYPVEFFAAMLSTEMADTDKVVKYIKDTRSHGIEVLPPQINLSEFSFTVRGKEIIFGLGAIKGVGQAAVEAILEARSKLPEQKFQSLSDFFENVDLRRVNKKVVECLIKAGAFDGFGYHRAQLFSGYERYMEIGEKQRKDKELGQASLFDLDVVDQDNNPTRLELESVPEWTRTTRLSYEKEVLGFFLSDHPLSGMGSLVQAWCKNQLGELSALENKSKVSLLATVSSMREILTKKGTRMGFVQIEDLSGGAEAVVFPDVYAQCEFLLKSDKPLVILGTLSKEENLSKILVEKVQALDEVIKSARMLKLKFTDINHMKPLRELMLESPGETRIDVEIDLPTMGKRVLMELKDPKGVRIQSSLWEELVHLVGDQGQIEVL